VANVPDTRTSVPTELASAVVGLAKVSETGTSVPTELAGAVGELVRVSETGTSVPTVGLITEIEVEANSTGVLLNEITIGPSEKDILGVGSTTGTSVVTVVPTVTVPLCAAEVGTTRVAVGSSPGKDVVNNREDVVASLKIDELSSSGVVLTVFGLSVALGRLTTAKLDVILDRDVVGSCTRLDVELRLCSENVGGCCVAVEGGCNTDPEADSGFCVVVAAEVGSS
jgi:hypothetical protein